MRRSDREATDFDEIVDIINKCDCIRLGFSSEPVPYILPLNFGIEVERDNEFARKLAPPLSEVETVTGWHREFEIRDE